METVKERIAHYQAQQFKKWVIISCTLLLISVTLLSFLSIQKLKSYFLLKKEYDQLTQEISACKSQLQSSRKLTAQHKLLKKQLSLFKKSSLADFLRAISLAMPAETYLTQIVIASTISLIGSATDMHELIHFTNALDSSLFNEISIKESVMEADRLRFEITALAKTVQP